MTTHQHTYDRPVAWAGVRAHRDCYDTAHDTEDPR